ncbi:MAG: hypothetical protein E6J64_08290 [Deltaproteobacteria bacterium]|nr:MAG: hypothetical protein E6J64_08290 [Deltaproteobacteria bacterium]
MGSRDAREVRIGSRQLRLVNLDKVLYPQAGERRHRSEGERAAARTARAPARRRKTATKARR